MPVLFDKAGGIRPDAAREAARVDGTTRAARAREALALVGLGSAFDKKPHQLSGGQRQRAAIARALVVNPTLLICDEITSALDVSIQAVIIELIDSLKREQGLSLIFVTHNLALVRSIAEKVAVLMAGRIAEIGPTAQVLGDPVSPEARKLLDDTPRLGCLQAAWPEDKPMDVRQGLR